MESEYYTALLPVPRKAKETLDLRIKNSVFVKEIFFRKIAHTHDFPLAWKFGGKEYLIIEWKSGDYRFGGRESSYYVMVRAGE